jgi:cytochrome bd-type quinol oxidase subunit 2
MNKIRQNISNNIVKISALGAGLTLAAGNAFANIDNSAQVNSATLGFNPNQLGLGNVLSFLIRVFFVAAGLAALIFLLLGALSWVTSGGNKENVEKAREKILAAVIGIIIVVLVVGVAVTLEQLVFKNKVCLGLTCPVNIPSLLN